MATITTFSAQQAAFRPDNKGNNATLTRTIDFSKTNVYASDVVQVFKMAANTFVHQVMIEVKTAEGATCTATVGITGDDADGFDADLNLNATAGTVTSGAPGTDAYLTAGGKAIGSSDDTIDLVMGHDTDAAIIDITVVASYIGRGV